MLAAAKASQLVDKALLPLHRHRARAAFRRRVGEEDGLSELPVVDCSGLLRDPPPPIGAPVRASEQSPVAAAGPSAFLGDGAGGAVHRFTRKGRAGAAETVAVKTIVVDAPEVARQWPATAVEEMACLARAAAAPHVLQLRGFDVTVTSDATAVARVHVVTELCEGGDLEMLVQRNDPRLLTGRRVACLGRQLAAAVAGVHACGLVHCDVKLANVLLTGPGGEVRLADFGAASPTTPDGRVAKPGFYGTPVYTPPELAAQEAAGRKLSAATFDRSVDVWSLGCVLLELLSGELPDTAYAALSHGALEALLGSLAQKPGAAPVVEAARACLRQEPAERPTAVEVEAMLAAGLAARRPAEHEHACALCAAAAAAAVEPTPARKRRKRWRPTASPAAARDGGGAGAGAGAAENDEGESKPAKRACVVS